MRMTPTNMALMFGIGVPAIYFGIQMIAAPYYSGYNFISMAASLLGSENSSAPAVFNAGAILSGLAALIAAYGFWVALEQLQINTILRWITVLVIVIAGLSSVWAGIFPMPDPRHGTNPFTVGIFVLPFFLMAALWSQATLALKRYFIFSMLVFFAMIPILSGISGLNTQGYGGLLQRIIALTAFPPLGVCAAFLIKRLETKNFAHQT